MWHLINTFFGLSDLSPTVGCRRQSKCEHSYLIAQSINPVHNASLSLSFLMTIIYINAFLRKRLSFLTAWICPSLDHPDVLPLQLHDLFRVHLNTRNYVSWHTTIHKCAEQWRLRNTLLGPVGEEGESKCSAATRGQGKEVPFSHLLFPLSASFSLVCHGNEGTEGGSLSCYWGGLCACEGGESGEMKRCSHINMECIEAEEGGIKWVWRGTLRAGKVDWVSHSGPRVVEHSGVSLLYPVAQQTTRSASHCVIVSH